MRLETSFKNVPKESIMDYWLNPPKSSFVKEMRVVEEWADGTKDVYTRMRIPLMSDRDMLCRMKTIKINDDRDYMEVTSIERDDCPLVKKVVRMFVSSNVMIQNNKDSPTDTIDYCEMTSFDLKGYFPASLMNATMASEGLKEFKTMYKHCLANKK